MVTGLTRYVAAKALLALPTLFILLTFFFLITHVLPGDPAAWIAGPYATPEDIAQIRHEMGLDRPLLNQLADYYSRLMRGDFGRSYASKRYVTDEILEAYPATLELSVASIIIAVLIGIPSGILAALKKDGILDQLVRMFNVSFASVPVFWLGILFQVSLGVSLGLFPIAFRTSVDVSIHRITGLLIVDSVLTLNLGGLASTLRHLFMPAMTMGLMMSPGISRIARGSMIAELSEDYITTAKAKGCTSRSIVYKYALRNAMIPIVTMIGMSLVGLMGGAILVETVFSLPGLGRLLVTAAYGRDYPLLQGCVLVISLVILSGTTIMDILYAKLDPRVRM